MASGTPELEAPGQTYTEGADRGVDSAKVDAAIQAFANYKTDIENTFQGFKEAITGYSDAFYGDTANKVKGYVDGVIDKCQDLLNEVATFDKKVTEAQESYSSQADSIYESIGSSGN